MRRGLRLRRALIPSALAVVLLVCVRAGAGALVDTLAAGRAEAASGSGQAPTAGDTFEPELGMPGAGRGSVVVLGASPKEAKEEVWGYVTIGEVPAIVDGKRYGNQYALLEHGEGTGWQVVPLPARSGGEPLVSGSTSLFPGSLGPLGGRVTGAGGVVLLTDGGIVARDPGAQPKLVPTPEAEPAKGEPVIGSGESLPPAPPPEHASTPFAAVEETAGGAQGTGLLIVPYGESVKASGAPAKALQPGVLHYDGTGWSREAIELGSSFTAESDFTPEALACGGSEVDASLPTNCWLLASYKSQPTASAPNRLALFRRVLSSPAGEPPSYTWRRQAVTGQLPGEESSATTDTALPADAQMLTVTSQGAWVDFKATTVASTRPITVSALVMAGGEGAAPTKQWCFPPSGSTCPSLGASLPIPYRSFAWPGSGAEPGTRVITGLSGGAMLELSGERFTDEIGAGGQVTGEGGAAFTSPDQGWMGNGVGDFTADREGQAELIHITPEPQGDELQETPVPFRSPLLAVAQAPGTTPGDPGAESIAVGVGGEIGRYRPAQGWQPESLLNSAGEVQTPTLRGVAWPEAARAYAVGDNGAMWVWRAETGLWEPDPAKPLNFISNLTAIAFASSQPGLGYAVGKGGIVLRFGKSWTQEQLPPELQGVNFTSVTFAGDEALAAYREVTQEPNAPNGPVEEGGVAIKEGEGPWHVDASAASLLSQLPHPKDTVLSKVTGLPDGGAVAAGPGLVIERESQAASWQLSPEPLPDASNVSALGAYRDSSGAVRAIVSIDLDGLLDPNSGLGLATGPFSGDLPPPSGQNQPPFMPPADPLPDSGYLLKGTSSGWSDMEHMALQAPASSDMPVRPDPVLALLVDPSGNVGLAVGGQTYDSAGANTGATFTGPEAQFETAAAMRFGAGAAAGEHVSVTGTGTTPADATFAVGGEAACASACADFANESLGPDVSLTHALQRSSQIASSSPGEPREFLYTGGRLEEVPQIGREEPRKLESTEEAERELARLASLLGSAPIPVHLAVSPNDVLGAGRGAFTSYLAPFLAEGGNTYYSYVSNGSGGEVQVIVLDYSEGELGATQQGWLAAKLEEAKERHIPAIVMGNASLGFTLGEGGPLLAKDATSVAAILVRGGASAYLFDYPGSNVQTQVSYGTEHIPAFGTGTLGYTQPPASFQTDSLGSSGFLILDVHSTEIGHVSEPSSAAPNFVTVTAHIEPNISELALNATNGVFLRRSQVAYFEALARRPPQGIQVRSNPQSVAAALVGAEPYDPIPFNCLGQNCANAVPTEYSFSSSDPEIGNFIAHDPTSANPRQVLLGADKLPVADSHSGLFCAFNPGTTTVSITTGGLTYSEPVTVQAGSVEYPCGTVSLKSVPPLEAPAKANFKVPSISPAAAPPPVSPQLPSVSVPPVPVFTQPLLVHPPASALANIFAQLPPAVATPVILPLPTLPVEPTPPSGAAQVFEPAPATREEREEKEAIETESSAAVTYDPNHSTEAGPWIVVFLAVIAAGAGVGMRPRRRSRRERPALAIASSRRHKPWEEDRRRRW